MQIGGRRGGESASVLKEVIQVMLQHRKTEPPVFRAKSGREPCFGKVGTGRGQEETTECSVLISSLLIPT